MRLERSPENRGAAPVPLSASAAAKAGCLHSWKEIAAHLRHSIRTVQRWEAEGLPVHRHPRKRRDAIYAYPEELDAWWTSHRVSLEQAERAGTLSAGESADAGEADAAGRLGRRPPFWLELSMAALAVGLAYLGLNLWRRGGRGERAEADAVRLTWNSGLTAYPALSPDGKLLAYTSDRGGEGNLSLWVQPVPEGEPMRLTRYEANDREPCFSPNGSKIAFRSDLDGGGIYIISVFGGEPRRLVRDGRGPRFSPDGAWIAYWVRDEAWDPGRMYIVPAAGGEPRWLRPEFGDAHNPVWAPDGKHILFCGTRTSGDPAGEHDWWVTPLDGGPAIKTNAVKAFGRRWLAPLQATFSDAVGTPGAWVGDWILFSARLGDSERLWRARIQPKTWTIASPPQRLTSGGTAQVQPAMAGDRVVFFGAQPSVGVWSQPADANTGKLTGEPAKLTFSVLDSFPSLSQDGKLLAFISTRSGNRDVWLKDLASAKETALTATTAAEGYPEISPDGSRVAYRIIETAKQAVYLAASSGGAPERVCDDCGLPTGWTPNGRLIFFEPGARVPWLGLLDPVSRKTFAILRAPEMGIHSAQCSPDGRWLAFHVTEQSHPARIYIAPFRGTKPVGVAEWIPVADDACSHTPVWSPDGNLLYFLSERDGFRCIWAQPLRSRDKRRDGPPFPVRHFHKASNSLLMNVRANPNQVGLSVAPDRVVFAMDELAGSIWMKQM